jgi:hypothetical protein
MPKNVSAGDRLRGEIKLFKEVCAMRVFSSTERERKI